MIENIYKSGIGLLAEQIERKRAIREFSKDVCGDLLNAHALSLGIIKSIYSEYLGIPGKTDESISTRLPLIASFIQGIDICETCICEGLYTQAAGILKQELETIAAIDECERGKRKNRKTPNVQCVKFGLGREYGVLNGIGHVSDKEIFEPLYKANADSKIEGQKPISILPQFNKELCSYFYAMHILLILNVIEKLDRLYIDMYNFQMPEDLKQAIYIIFTILDKSGFLTVEAEANGK